MATAVEVTFGAIDPFRLIDLDGACRDEDALRQLRFSDEDLREVYRTMRTARVLDREAIALQRQGQLALYASFCGQEAAQIGSALTLAPLDWVFGTYRDSAVTLLRGPKFADVLSMFRGNMLWEGDVAKTNFAPLTIPIATQALHAVGVAMGVKLAGEPTIAMAYMGDGATSEGDFHEAMNFAAVFEAPCVFFVQNNQYAISVPLSRQTRAPTLAHKAVGYGMPGYRCDGNDVLATYAVTKQAVERARSGGGPSMIEALTYRMEAHTTSDDPSRYRCEDELVRAAAFDPVARMEKFLRARDLLDEEFARSVEEDAREQARRVRDEIYDAPHGDPREVFEHVYVDPPRSFARQRAQLEGELEARDDAS